MQRVASRRPAGASRRPPPPPPTKTEARCLLVALPESSTLNPSRSSRPRVASWLAPASLSIAPLADPRAASSRLRRSTTEGAKVYLTVGDPKVAMAVVKTIERGVSRACLAAVARSMRSCRPHLPSPPPLGAGKVAEVSSGSSSNAAKTSACRDGNTVERVSVQGAASARCEPLPLARST
jgi:hypothetical protein